MAFEKILFDLWAFVAFEFFSFDLMGLCGLLDFSFDFGSDFLLFLHVSSRRHVDPLIHVDFDIEASDIWHPNYFQEQWEGWIEMNGMEVLWMS